MFLFEMLEDMLETPVFLGQFEHCLKNQYFQIRLMPDLLAF